MVGNLLAELVVDCLAGLSAVQVVERQLVQPALLQPLQELFRRLDGQRDCGRRARNAGRSQRAQRAMPQRRGRRFLASK